MNATGEPGSPFAHEVIERLQAVYAIEAEIRGSSAEQRLASRRAKTAPAMAAPKALLTAMAGRFFSQSKLAEAIKYALIHWDGLTLFLRDGRVEVDSNTFECSMRPIAMGRRNSLFSGSEGGAESWAILASLVKTAKLHDLDPQAYLTDVLERIVSGQTKRHQLHELLAWNWKAVRAAHHRTPYRANWSAMPSLIFFAAAISTLPPSMSPCLSLAKPRP